MESSAPPPSEDVAIRLVGLRKRYLSREVLSGIDLEVSSGTVFGYIGPNGAGKTTTVKILAGLILDFEGSASVTGIDLREDAREIKRRIGFVPENAPLYEGLTAYELLELIGRLRELEEQLLERRAYSLLEAFGLASQAHARLGSFSKGMRQKVLLASSLLHDPDVLFLDEPLSGLDVESTIFVKELIRALAQAGKTIFYCSHMMDIVERVCDRIVILNGGVIVADGSFDELAHGERDRSLEEVFSELTGQHEPEDRVAQLIESLQDDSS